MWKSTLPWERVVLSNPITPELFVDVIYINTKLWYIFWELVKFLEFFIIFEIWNFCVLHVKKYSSMRKSSSVQLRSSQNFMWMLSTSIQCSGINFVNYWKFCNFLWFLKTGILAFYIWKSTPPWQRVVLSNSDHARTFCGCYLHQYKALTQILRIGQSSGIFYDFWKLRN